MDVRGKVKTLEQLRHLRGEVDMLSQRIAELELAARGGAGRITGMPRASRRRDRTGDMAVQLSLLWDKLLVFDQLIVDGRREHLQDEPPLVTVNVFNHNKFV